MNFHYSVAKWIVKCVVHKINDAITLVQNEKLRLKSGYKQLFFSRRVIVANFHYLIASHIHLVINILTY